jgi:hypothetical protein
MALPLQWLSPAVSLTLYRSFPTDADNLTLPSDNTLLMVILPWRQYTLDGNTLLLNTPFLNTF